MVVHAYGIHRIIWPLVLIVAGWASGCSLAQDADRVNDAPTLNVDLSKIPNGRYLGEHRVEGIDYEVEVSVASHRITGIRVLIGMQRVFQKRCALCEVMDLIWEMIELQSFDVDAVTGATQTSRAIVHAISDALKPPYTQD